MQKKITRIREFTRGDNIEDMFNELIEFANQAINRGQCDYVREVREDGNANYIRRSENDD